VLDSTHTVRVAIDGVDAAGKTTLADELAERLRAQGRFVIRAGIDGFHNPRHIRYALGPESPEGYYSHSFNLGTLIKALLHPLGPGGTGRYRTAVFDYREDAFVDVPEMEAKPRSILLFDGIFLLRPELRSCWDYSIFVKADFDVTLARALRRDPKLWRDSKELEQRYKCRYIPAQRCYLDECRPESCANVVIDNNNPSHPIIMPSTSGS
jgi:uridine kinase